MTLHGSNNQYRYPGFPLDPPLRSRFQCYALPRQDTDSIPPALEDIATFASTVNSLNEQLPEFPMSRMASLSRLTQASTLPLGTLLSLAYPTLHLSSDKVETISNIARASRISISAGSPTFVASSDSTPSTSPFTLMQLLHGSIGSDFCVLGPKGVGKTHLVQGLLRAMKLPSRYFYLYKGMTARDLLQRRGTLQNGDTTWIDSPIVIAALKGEVAVLEGLDTLVPGTAAVLQRLIQERELVLPDGSHLVEWERFQALKPFRKRKHVVQMRPIHPKFRL